MPLGSLLALNQNYGSGNTGAEKNYDFQAGVHVLNNLSSIYQLPIYGVNFASLYGRQITDAATGTCFTINIVPVFRQVSANIVSEPNVAQAAVLSDQMCRWDSVNPPQVVAALDTTSLSAAQFQAQSFICGGYGIPTVSMYYTNATFQDKVAYRYASMTNPRSLLEPDTLFPFMTQYKWKRVAILLSGTLTNPDLLINTQAAGAAAGATLYIQTIPSGTTNCKSYVNNIVSGQWKVIFLLGSNTNLAPCVVEIVHNQNLTHDNYILVLGYTLLNGLATQTIPFYAKALNLTSAEFKGTFGFLALTSPTSANLAANFLAARKAMVPPPSTAATSMTNFYLLQDGLIHTVQGLAGMLAQSVSVAAGASGLTPGTAGSSAPSATPATNQGFAQTFTQTFLAAMSTNGQFNSYNVNYTAAFTGAIQSFNISVPFSAIRYNSSNIFPYFLNSSGTAQVSTLYDKLYFDNNGYPLSSIGIYNFDGTTMEHLANFDGVTSQYELQSNLSIVWPNTDILYRYVNGIPTDAEPPTVFTVKCSACNAALVGINAADTIFSTEVNVQSAVSFTVNPNVPFLQEISTSCDGTNPLTYSTVPTNLLALLRNYTDGGAAPLSLDSGSGAMQLDSGLFVQAMLNIYEAFFAPAITSSLSPVVPGSANTAPITSFFQVLDGGNAAVQLSFMINCNNGANNISNVFQIATMPQSTSYTPSGTTEIAMTVVNGLALVCVAAVMGTVFMNRYERVIFSSSFLFLMTILFGFMLLFVSSLLSIQHASAAVCYSKLITFHFGFTLTLGSLFIKTYRLHRIFNWKSFMLVKISDWQLMIAVVGLLVVDSVVIVLWSELSGYGIESSTRPHCYTGGVGDTIFPAIFAGIKGLILVSGIYLTFKVRSVPANFNESAFISVVIYNTTVLALIYIVVLFGFSMSPDTLATFTSILLFIAALINFFIFFAPKVLAVHQLYLNTISNTTKNQTSSGEKDGASGGGVSARHSTRKPLPIGDPTAPAKSAEVGADADDTSLPIDKHTSLEYLRARLQKLRKKFLLAVLSTKKGEADLNRFRKRCTELNDVVEAGYDALRTVTMDLRINMERFQRTPHQKKERTAQQVKDDESLLEDLDEMLSVPVDNIDNIDDNGQSYEIIHPKTSNASRRKSGNQHSMPSSGRKLGGEQSRLNLAGSTVAMSELAAPKARLGATPSPGPTYHTVAAGSGQPNEAAVLKYTFNAPYSPAAPNSARDSHVPIGGVETDGQGLGRESTMSTSASASFNQDERKGQPISVIPPLSTPVLGSDHRSSAFGGSRGTLPGMHMDSAASARSAVQATNIGDTSSRRDSTPSTRHFV